MLDREDVAELIREDIEAVAKMVVDNPSRLSVNTEIGEQTIVFRLMVPKEEIGKVIGKQGKMAESLRTLLNSFASRRGVRAVLSIED